MASVTAAVETSLEVKDIVEVKKALRRFFLIQTQTDKTTRTKTYCELCKEPVVMIAMSRSPNQESTKKPPPPISESQNHHQRGGGIVSLSSSQLNMILNSLLAPCPLQSRYVNCSLTLTLCRQCETCCVQLISHFERLEKLRKGFNELRKELGEKVIQKALGLSAEEWKKEVESAEVIFPSCIRFLKRTKDVSVGTTEGDLAEEGDLLEQERRRLINQMTPPSSTTTFGTTDTESPEPVQNKCLLMDDVEIEYENVHEDILLRDIEENMKVIRNFNSSWNLPCTKNNNTKANDNQEETLPKSKDEGHKTDTESMSCSTAHVQVIQTPPTQLDLFIPIVNDGNLNSTETKTELESCSLALEVSHSKARSLRTRHPVNYNVFTREKLTVPVKLLDKAEPVFRSSFSSESSDSGDNNINNIDDEESLDNDRLFIPLPANYMDKQEIDSIDQGAFSPADYTLPQFNHARGLNLHVGKKHILEKIGRKAPILQKSTKKYVKKRKLYSCKICGKTLSSRWALSYHTSNVHCVKKVSCEQCGKELKGLNSLKLHVQHVHSKKPEKLTDPGSPKDKKTSSIRKPGTVHSRKTDSVLQCPYCSSKSYQNSSTLKRHISECHTKEIESKAPQFCDVCFKCFQSTRKLRGHMKEHMNKKCPLCGVVIRKNWKLHMQVHTGERLYKCSRCTLSFNYRSQLENHESNHTRKQLMEKRRLASVDRTIYRPL